MDDEKTRRQREIEALQFIDGELLRILRGMISASNIRAGICEVSLFHKLPIPDAFKAIDFNPLNDQVLAMRGAVSLEIHKLQFPEGARPVEKAAA